MILILQHNVNVTVFDAFRADKLPAPKTKGSFWLRLESLMTILLPRDPSAPHNLRNKYRLTSKPRRLLLAVIDLWLLYVSFSIIYWIYVPKGFTENLCNYSDSLYFSVVTGTTLGFGDFTPVSIGAKYIVVGEVFACFLFALVIIANTISLLPKPRDIAD